MKPAIRIAHLVAAAAALTAPSLASAEQVFLKLDGVEGESTQKDHKGEIEVFSYSWGTSRGPTAQGDVRGQTAKSCISEFNFMKMLDKSSTGIVGNSVGGAPIPKARLSMSAGVEGAKEYFSFELTNVMVSSYQMSGSSERPMESVSLRFSSAEMSYKVQDDKGVLGPATKVVLKVGNCN